MKPFKGPSVVETIKEKCRVCFTCVRECPAKAIKIVDGQAEVIAERCIGCGNCVKVCSQKAKKVLSSIEDVVKILSTEGVKVAILAPSFPAEFFDVDHRKVIGALKMLGFTHVHEVGFGADLVALAYKNLLANPKNKDKNYIATTCPAIVTYVEKYHPEIVDLLAPIVSPMIASAKVVKKIHGDDSKIVFIGPCVAKKVERGKQKGKNSCVDEVLTFVELRDLFKLKNINRDNAIPADFDPPLAGKGALFSISRGMLHAAGIKEDLIEGNVAVADGRVNFVEAIKEFEEEALKTHLLETLCCEGCIMGPGVNSDIPLYKRKSKISIYVNDKLKKMDTKEWEKYIKKFVDIDLSTSFTASDQRMPIAPNDEVENVLRRMGKFKREDELNCGACGYQTCRAHAVAIIDGLAENEMCLPYTIERLKDTVSDLENSYSELKDLKEALHHRDKLASMGQLASGVAHEINNPLGVVLMYAYMMLEKLEGQDDTNAQDIKMIVEQAERCKKIVSGLLDFSRQNRVVKNILNIEELVNKCIELSSVPENIKVEVISSLKNPEAELDKDQFSQVIINLITNSVDAMSQPDMDHKLTINIEQDGATLLVEFEDTGTGIPEKHIKRIFDPFFTTKEIGKGTGLGLPVSYGIVKMHSGDIRVESNSDPEKGATGTKVIISIPKYEIKRGGKTYGKDFFSR